MTALTEASNADPGVTTAPEQVAAIRKATVRDVPEILRIVNDYAKDQVMLARSPLSLYENLRDFWVAVRGDRIVGSGALHVVWGDLAEIRSIAVEPHEKGRGTGKLLAKALLREADALLLPRVFAFTYVPGFFQKLGFRIVEHSELPYKVFADCLNCPKYNCCDEIAMLIELRSVEGTFPTSGPLSRPLPQVFHGQYRAHPTLERPPEPGSPATGSASSEHRSTEV